MGRLDHRIAIITGAGRGIGAATASLFAAEGAAVVLNDIDGAELNQIAEDLSGRGHRVEAVEGDCAQPPVASAINRAGEALGGTDIIVNNAGSVRDASFHAMTPDQWDGAFGPSVNGTVAVLQACLPGMRERATAELAGQGQVAYQRKIVNTAAAAFLSGNPGQANLTAAGGAIVGLTRTLARELGGFGINVNAVAPGFVQTRLVEAQSAVDGPGLPEAVRQMTRAMTALGRHGQPEDIARAHLFLASSDADFVTGVTLPVTGGLLGTFV